MAKQGFVAFDLGAESGRAMLAVLEGQRVTLEECHRFANLPQHLPTGLHWNLLELWSNLVQGLKLAGEAAAKHQAPLVSVGVDTWGVDYALVGKSGQVLTLPFCYRDARNAPAYEQVIERLGKKTIYDATGIQFLPFNTLYQLHAQRLSEQGILNQADRLLMLPDLLHYFFTGKMVVEATDASTTQMIDPRSGKWAAQLLRKLELPTHLLAEIVQAGSVIGPIRDEILKEAALDEASIQVVAPGTHDTAAAVAAAPVDMGADQTWAYLSSGTWSLMGAELDEPVLSDAAFEAGFTNERGVGGKIRFLKNIAGLWLVQECRREFERQGQSFDYGELTRLAGEAEPFRTLVNPDHPPFASPGDMPAKIAEFAQSTGQPAPESPGQFVRCCLESLAFAYRRTLMNVEKIIGRQIAVLHILGGGGQNDLLNQMTADAIGRPVVVGPFEATAVGNALTQAMGLGAIADLAELRQVVRNSFDPATVMPASAPAWDQQSQRFTEIVTASH